MQYYKKLIVIKTCMQIFLNMLDGFCDTALIQHSYKFCRCKKKGKRSIDLYTYTK